MEYYVSAMVVYSETVEADSPEEALDSFLDACPYDTDGTIYVTEENGFEKQWEF